MENEQQLIILERVCERDIDLLLMRLFTERKEAVKLFLEPDCDIVSVAHSVSNLHGESDIVVTYRQKEKLCALMIENKIDAQAQDEQYERYRLRGDSLMEQEKVTDYKIYIVAPQEYLRKNGEAQKYKNKVAYEDILTKCKQENDLFSCALLQKAIDKSPETAIIDNAVTEFWLKYYTYQETFYPHLELHKSSYQKGPNATWPDFKTKQYIKGTKLLHKSEQGFVDLEFRGKAEEKPRLYNETHNQLEPGMQWVITGKSASIRIEVDKIDFSKPFEQYEKEIKKAFEAIDRLYRLAQRLNITI